MRSSTRSRVCPNVRGASGRPQTQTGSSPCAVSVAIANFLLRRYEAVFSRHLEDRWTEYGSQGAGQAIRKATFSPWMKMLKLACNALAGSPKQTLLRSPSRSRAKGIGNGKGYGKGYGEGREPRWWYSGSSLSITGPQVWSLTAS